MTINFHKLLSLLLVFFCYFSFSSAYAEDIPKTIEYEDSKLSLNGQGTRIKFFMKVYNTGLYLLTPSSNAEEILNADEAMAIRLDVTSTLVTVDAMKDALNEGLIKSTGNNINPISNEIEQLSSTFNSNVSDGDFFEFIYIPNSGTNVLKNSEYIDTIPGIEFKKAFFGIWLSINPIQKNLKKAMLGD